MISRGLYVANAIATSQRCVAGCGSLPPEHPYHDNPQRHGGRAHLDRDPREWIEHRRRHPAKAVVRQAPAPAGERIAPQALFSAASAAGREPAPVRRRCEPPRATWDGASRLPPQYRRSGVAPSSSVRSMTQRSPAAHPTRMYIAGRATGTVSNRSLLARKCARPFALGRSNWSVEFDAACTMPSSGVDRNVTEPLPGMRFALAQRRLVQWTGSRLRIAVSTPTIAGPGDAQ